MAQTMRAVDVKDGAGPASSLFINESYSRPIPEPSQCLVRVKAFGLNRADTIQREGKYPPPPGVSKVMGLEFSGIVEEAGKEAHSKEGGGWKKGDEVIGLCYGGAYAEYVAVDERMLIHKPKDMTWECTGGVCEVWFTALQAMYIVGRYDPKTTKSVLWHAGASSVSLAGQQLCLVANEDTNLPPPKVFVTARQDSKIEFCKDVIGATGGVNPTTTQDWASKIKELNDGEGMDLVIDYIGASYFQQNLDVMARDGRIVQLGTMGGTKLPEGVDISAFLRKRVAFEGSTLRSRDVNYQGKIRDLFVEKCLPFMIEGGGRGGGSESEGGLGSKIGHATNPSGRDGPGGKRKFENHIDRVYSWKDIAKAHQALENNETKGKIVCVID